MPKLGTGDRHPTGHFWPKVRCLPLPRLLDKPVSVPNLGTEIRAKEWSQNEEKNGVQEGPFFGTDFRSQYWNGLAPIFHRFAAEGAVKMRVDLVVMGKEARTSQWVVNAFSRASSGTKGSDLRRQLIFAPCCCRHL